MSLFTENREVCHNVTSWQVDQVMQCWGVWSVVIKI